MAQIDWHPGKLGVLFLLHVHLPLAGLLLQLRHLKSLLRKQREKEIREIEEMEGVEEVILVGEILGVEQVGSLDKTLPETR